MVEPAVTGIPTGTAQSVPDASSTTPVVVRINPSRAIPHANIRQVRTAWVHGLMAKIKQEGWSETHPVVYPTVPFEEMKVMSLLPENELRARLDAEGMRFMILDGAHRIKALRLLQMDPDVPSIGPDFLIQVHVLPEQKSVVQRAIDAIAQNKAASHSFARKTFCDDLWTLNGIVSSVVKRVVALSGRIADAPVAPDPNATSSGRRARRKKKAQFEVDFFTAVDRLPEADRETPGFQQAYERYIDKFMFQKDNPELRRPFDPYSDHDYDRIHGSAVLALIEDTHIPTEQDSLRATKTGWKENEGVKVKLRLLRQLIPSYAVPIGDDDGEQIGLGGNGVVMTPNRSIPLWDYLCAVNDKLSCNSPDLLSYNRIYRTCFRNNAFTRPFCGLLMLIMASYKQDGTRPFAEGGRSTSKRKTRRRSDGERRREWDVVVLYPAICAVFAQYNAAASCLDEYERIEDLVLPFLKFDRNTLLLTVVDGEAWACSTLDSLGIPEDQCTTNVHPKLGKTYADMTPAEKTNDDESRQLSTFFLEDVERCATLSSEQHSRDFGLFDNVHDLVANNLPKSEITGYVRARFRVLRAAGFNVPTPTNAEDAQECSEREDSGSERSPTGPPKKSMRMSVPETEAAADLQAAMRVAEASLASVDLVHMSCASFEVFAELPETQALYGTVSLVLTDPPYNTRREAGASNSEHDKFSPSDMQKAADVIERLLRPYGHAFIFCSYQQSFEWRKSLLAAGGGSCLKVPAVPEVIIRDPSAVNQGGHFRYHRMNVVEYAWHVYKDNSSTVGDYESTVGFGNASLQLTSGSSMPSYVNAIDRYVPPKAPELLRSNGSVLRPEQKSVTLLRDIIRLFAPAPTDIVVDLFAGTMSTVVAALIEGRPVYACEKFEDCFRIGQQRVQNFQYRRGAAGLVHGLSQDQRVLLQSFVPPRSAAPDVLAHEPEVYEKENATAPGNGSD